MSIYVNLAPLVLASGSPRRKELLGSLGLDFSIMTSPDEEARHLAGEAPAAYAARAARQKALAARSTLYASFSADVRHIAKWQPDFSAQPAILAADTIVVLAGEVLGKPANHADALAMLKRLAGATHTVFTACCLLLPDGTEDALIGKSLVSMWQAPEEALQAYAASEEPMDKAGAYAVQGLGAFLVERIEGSWSNVVGLPLTEVTRLLLKHKIIKPGGGLV